MHLSWLRKPTLMKFHCPVLVNVKAEKGSIELGSYSASERTTIEGVPADRRRDSLVWRRGCDEITTFGSVLTLIA
jgi:hypothetical protein